jgi:5-formyltetrahydrofolate cyclo-ligase
MQDLKEKKSEIRNSTLARRDALTEKERKAKSAQIMDRLFDFANFLEARVVLFYMNTKSEVGTVDMITRAMAAEKSIVLPCVDKKEKQLITYKVDDLEQDLEPGYGKIPEPTAQRCKQMPFEHIDLAIIPGIAFDERGGRIGHGTGFYDRLIPKLEITTRKVGLAFECQIVPQIPMEPHDRYIDIIITEKRTIYKI